MGDSWSGTAWRCFGGEGWWVGDGLSGGTTGCQALGGAHHERS